MTLPQLAEFNERSTGSTQHKKDFDPSLLRPRIPMVQDTELIIQLRNVAGWDAEKVGSWFKQTEEGLRLQWLFELPETESTVVGMCAVDLEDYQNDPEVASRATKTVVFTGLIVLPEFRGKGYARWMALYAEKETKRLLGEKAEWITMNTLVVNKVSIVLHQSIGYEIFKEEDRYKIYETHFPLPPAVYLRKRLIPDTEAAKQ